MVSPHCCPVPLAEGQCSYAAEELPHATVLIDRIQRHPQQIENPLWCPHRSVHRSRLVAHDQSKRHRLIRFARHPPHELPDGGIDVQIRRGARALDLDIESASVLLGNDVDDIRVGADRPPLRRLPPREAPGHASLITSHTGQGRPETSVPNNTTARNTSGAACDDSGMPRQIMR